MHTAIMVMGVSGCGKSTIGSALAHVLGGVFLDGDDYHPKTNVDHMTAGHPLTDDMRWPWLNDLAVAVNGQRQLSVTVFACSALRKIYRDYLRAAIPDLKIAYLEASDDMVLARLNGREGHYMPSSLLDSQFATLEVPQHATAVVSINQSVEDIVKALSAIV